VELVGDQSLAFTTLRDKLAAAEGKGRGWAKDQINDAIRQGILNTKNNRVIAPAPLADEMRVDDTDDKPF
jgi:hypothetical protein